MQIFKKTVHLLWKKTVAPNENKENGKRYLTKVRVKLNDAFYSFVYYFFDIASIFLIFGTITGTGFVHSRMT